MNYARLEIKRDITRTSEQRRATYIMMRRSQFEAEVYESLSCLPMAARRKLDLLGIKISLDQWQHLGRGERLMICHAPTNSAEESGALRLFIDEAPIAKA